jgi:RHS repeat-associated protein
MITAFVLFSTTCLTSISAAHATGTVSSPIATGATLAQDAPPSDAGGSQATSPTVVREMTDAEAVNSRKYLLSNGTVRVDYYRQPVNFRDPQTGKMKAIDPSLRNGILSGRAVSTNGSNSFQLQLPRALSGDWVSLETSAARVALRPATRAASPGIVSAPLTGVVASSRTTTNVAYAGAFAGATLAYESRSDGMKETIVVSAPTSCTIYSFDLSLSGLTPKLEDDGSISLCSGKETTPSMTIPSPGMWDSAVTSGPAYTDQVHYELSGTGPVYRLDVVADPAWMSDPARVYPVMIDPSVVTTSGLPDDTYVSSAANCQDTKYYSATFVYMNNHYSAANWTEQAIFQPGSTLIADLAREKALGYQVASARLRLILLGDYGNVPQIYGSMCTTQNPYTGLSNLTWNTRPPTVAGYNTTPSITATTILNAADTWDVTAMTSYWQLAGTPWQNANAIFSNSTSNSRWQYKDRDNTGTKPLYTIDYSPTPVVTLTSPTGGQYASAPAATWTYSEGLSNPQAEYQIEVATSPSGPAVATTDVVSAAASGSLPAPAGGWAVGQTYYVHMRAASQPVAGHFVWSPWTDWGAGSFTLTLPDTTPPTTSSNAQPFYTGTANITLSAIDSGSGVAATYYKVDGGSQQTGTAVTVSGAGSHTIYFWSVDNAGNIETQKSASFVIDTTPPTTTSNALSFYNGTAVITLSAGDTGSGVGATYYKVDGGAQTAGTAITVLPPASGTATHTISFWSVDNAGNVETAHMATFTVIPYDGAPPLTTSNAQSAYNGTATISLTATDTGSGVAHTYYAVDTAPFTTTGGAQSVSGSMTVVTFTSSGPLVCAGSLAGASVLVIGGGGGGGGGDNGNAGGGGAGDVLVATGVTLSGSMGVTVGGGGAGGAPGSALVKYNGVTGTASTFATLTANGGGFGSAYRGGAGGAGGSGGGGAQNYSGAEQGGSATGGSTGSGITNYDNAGGSGVNSDSNYWGAAGGGGAGAEGGAPTLYQRGGAGGAGVSPVLNGIAYGPFGGGGSGATNVGSSNGQVVTGGSGGGGAGGYTTTAPTAGAPNTGGGGGGGNDHPNAGGAGGSGIVIVSYPTPMPQAGTTITVASPASGTATHTIYFWSVDNAGNVESQHTASFTVSPYAIPPAPTGTVTVSSASTTSSAYFTEVDTNGAGVNDMRDDTNAGGRGSATLSWSPVAGATTYNVYLLDGATYQHVGTTGTTSWTSAGAGIYPTDSQIASMSAGATGSPFPGGAGLDLRDDPTPLYAKMAGASVANVPAYFFKVTAANAGGETTLSTQPTTTVQLANRTSYVNAIAQHTTHDLGSVAGAGASVQLDAGALTLDPTDLQVNTYGPQAAITRTYSSQLTTATIFAPGWRFGFERSVRPGASGTLVYTDETGRGCVFTGAGTGVWASPRGMVATATLDSGAYTLRFRDGTAAAYDQTSGRILREYDRHGTDDAHSTVYDWSTPGQLTIKAANAHAIVVTFNAGLISKATYTCDGVTREVDYDSGVNFGRVTAALSSSESREIDYSYAGISPRIASVSVAGFAPGGVAATWGFGYEATLGARLIAVQNPTTTVARPLAFTYPTTGTATVSYPARVGALATSDTTVTETYSWDPMGFETAHGNAATSDLSRDGTSTADEGPSLCVRHEVTAAGVITDHLSNSAGDELVSADALGNATTSTYDSYGNALSTVDPRGAVTNFTYNTYGDKTSESQQLNSSEWSLTTWDFGSDTFGRPASMSQAISATQTAVTTYSGYGDFLSPQSTTQKAVALSPTDTVGVDLTTQDSYDSFGDLLTETDPAGVQVKTDTYDLSGRLIAVQSAPATAGATPAITRDRYDLLGNEVETSATAGSAWASWTIKTVDPMGLVTTETTYIYAYGYPVPASTTTHTYDGSGNEIVAVASNVGTSTTEHDANGNVVAQWAPSAGDQTDPAQAQTDVNDPDGRTLQSQLTTDAPDITAYAPGTDDVAVSDPAASGPTTYSYDPDHNQTTQTAPTSNGRSVTTTSAYDLGGRQISATDASGNVTTTTYDLLGRVTEVTLQGSGGVPSSCTTTTYNSQGWVLSTVDPNGVTTNYTYDNDGRVLRQDVSTAGLPAIPDATTQNAYDALGNDISTTNPDGTSVTNTYDPFGRLVEGVQTATDGSTAHDVHTSYDEMGRAIETSDTKVGIVTDFTYPTTPDGWSVTTRQFAGTTLTVKKLANGNEFYRGMSIPGGGMYADTVGRDLAQRPVAIWTENVDRMVDYDDAGRIVGQLTFSTLATPTTYAYDPASGLETTQRIYVPGMSTSQNAASTFTYTDAGRLASATKNSVTTNYTYDSAGDITTAGPTNLYYAGGELSASSIGSAVTTYSFDARGRRISQASSTASATFGWNASDRLTNYSSSNGAVTATFTYDASGQRVASVVSSGGVVTTQTAYTYDGLQLVRVVSNCPNQTSNDTTLTYLYDETGQPTSLEAQVGTYTTPFDVAITTDARGDVVALGDGTSTIAGWEYDAYGNVTGTFGPVGGSDIPAAAEALIAATEPLRYAGYVYDPFSGLYYCSQRYYDPATTQWISADPAKADGDASTYQYCGGDPVEATDPSGLATYISVFARPGSLLDLGHAWITISTTDKKGIHVDGLKVSKGQTISVGLWETDSMHDGVWFDREAQEQKDHIGAGDPDPLKGRVSLRAKINSAKLKKLNAFIKQNTNVYDLIDHNCAWFAMHAWNLVASPRVNSWGNYWGVNANLPSKLAADIKSKGGHANQTLGKYSRAEVGYYAGGNFVNVDPGDASSF